MRVLKSLYKPKKNKLQLPNVTLCIADCMNHELAKYAIDCCTAQVDFGKVIFFTDKEFKDYPVEIVERFKNKEDYDYFIMKKLNSYIATDFVLIIQWDGLILDTKYWSEDFLEYDYIGAIWPWHKQYKVGNAGFCIRSKKLLEILANDNTLTETSPEDVNVSCKYRPYLESKGITYASEFIADTFSVERSTAENTFGFHGFFHFPKYIDEQYIEELLEKLSHSTLLSSETQEVILYYHNINHYDTVITIMKHILSRCDHPQKNEFIHYINQFTMNKEII
jgi:hypothetical protein